MSFTVLHRSDSSSLLLSGKRIERGAFTVLRDAGAVLAEARSEAQSMREDAEFVVEAQREQAHRIGFESGRVAGVQAVLGTLETERRMRELLASRIADVVEHCVRTILGDVGAAEVFERRVRQMLKNATTGGEATLHVCPSQAHLAQAIVDEQTQALGAPLNWLTVFSDDHCKRDILVLETRVGFIDSSVELTLNSARDIISRAVTQAATQLGI
jgi:type III secretion system HrpE/YscL family protein